MLNTISTFITSINTGLPIFPRNNRGGLKSFASNNEPVTKVIWRRGNEDSYMELLAHQNSSMTYVIKRLWKPQCKRCMEVNYVGRLWTVPFVKDTDPLIAIAAKKPKLSYRCTRCKAGYVFKPDFGASEWEDFTNSP